MRQFPLVILLNITALSYNHLSAQNALPDTAYRRIALQQVTDFYFRSIAENGFLNYGNEVIEYPNKTISHPFYAKDGFVNGSVNGFGVIYNDIPIKYDIVHDKLIALAFNKILNIEQISERIESFNLSGHEFVRVFTDSINQSVIETGFYERLYNGKSVSVLAKRRKVASELIKDGRSELTFKERSYHFVRKDDVYYPVSDKGSVMFVFKDKRKELESFLKKNKIRFNKNREYAMTRMAEYYELLKG